MQMVEEITQGMPEGCIVRIMSPTDDGYRVTEVWESDLRSTGNGSATVLTPLLSGVVGDEPINGMKWGPHTRQSDQGQHQAAFRATSANAEGQQPPSL